MPTEQDRRRRTPRRRAGAGCGSARTCTPRRTAVCSSISRVAGRRGDAARGLGAGMRHPHPRRAPAARPSSPPGRRVPRRGARATPGCAAGSPAAPRRRAARCSARRPTRSSSTCASATSVLRWMRTKPASAHRCSRADSGVRTGGCPSRCAGARSHPALRRSAPATGARTGSLRPARPGSSRRRLRRAQPRRSPTPRGAPPRPAGPRAPAS